VLTSSSVRYPGSLHRAVAIRSHGQSHNGPMAHILLPASPKYRVNAPKRTLRSLSRACFAEGGGGLHFNIFNKAPASRLRCCAAPSASSGSRGLSHGYPGK
jgi:hypothetical protein